MSRIDQDVIADKSIEELSLLLKEYEQFRGGPLYEHLMDWADHCKMVSQDDALRFFMDGKVKEGAEGVGMALCFNIVMMHLAEGLRESVMDSMEARR